MSILDGPMGQLAATLLDNVQLGSRAAVIRRPGSGGVLNPATGNVEGGTDPVDFACRVAFAEYSESQIDGTLIKAGDRRAIVARQTIGIEPQAQEDELVEGGRTWQIMSVTAFSSGELEAAFELHVRR